MANDGRARCSCGRRHKSFIMVVDGESVRVLGCEPCFDIRDPESGMTTREAMAEVARAVRKMAVS